MNRRLFMTRLRYAIYGAMAASVVAGAVHLLSAEPPRANDWGTVTSVQPFVEPDATVTTVRVAQKCSIARFGVHPWLPPGFAPNAEWGRETTRALTLMGLPPEAAAEATTRIRAGKFDGVFGMGDEYGIDTRDGAFYYPTFATTYRKGGDAYVCTDSRVNFGTNARKEFGILYTVKDAAGRTWHVGEFSACGNVSLLTPAAPGWIPPGLRLPPGVAPLDIPEPGTLALTLVALGAMIFLFWKK